MRNLLSVFALPLIAVVILIAGIGGGNMLLTIPTLFCGFPMALWWSGYVTGRRGRIQSPISFGERAERRIVPAAASLTDDERNALERYRNRRTAKQAVNGAADKVERDFS